MDPTIICADDEIVPTYEESVEQGAFSKSSSNTKLHYHSRPAASLTQQLADVRTYRINSILTAYIDPLLQSQALAGLFKTTLVLVPSNITALQRPSSTGFGVRDVIEGSGDAISNDDREAVIGFPSEDYIKLVRLHGDEYTLEFWRQPAVINELEAALKARLQASGHRLAGLEEAEKPAAAIIPSPAESPRTKRSFFRRTSKTAAAPSITNPEPEGNWRSVKETALDPGHVRVSVRLQDVCLRVVTEMELYETRTAKAVVVGIEIGS